MLIPSPSVPLDGKTRYELCLILINEHEARFVAGSTELLRYHMIQHRIPNPASKIAAYGATVLSTHWASSPARGIPLYQRNFCRVAASKLPRKSNPGLFFGQPRLFPLFCQDILPRTVLNIFDNASLCAAPNGGFWKSKIPSARNTTHSR